MNKAIAAFVFVSLGCLARAEDVTDIVRRVERNQTYDASSMDAKLVARNRLGVTESSFTAYSRSGGDTLVVVTAGPDRGQKVLRQKDSVYLYYPDAEEVIWLKGSALKDSMMGSDFSYEDLTDDGTILSRYDAALLGEETYVGAPCWKIALTAKTRNEAYARQELLVDRRSYVAVHGIFFSASGKAIREMSCADVREVSGKYIPFSSVMRDLLKKNTTSELTLTRVELGVEIPNSYFNREELSW